MTATRTLDVANSDAARERQHLVQTCEVDRRPCEVEAALLPGLSGIDAADTQQALRRGRICLPCGMCRRGERDALNLRHLRLGRTERLLLIGAAIPDAKKGTRLHDCWPPEEWRQGGRGLAVSATRAAKRLGNAGLVQCPRLRDHLLFGRKRYCLWRTPLGALVIWYVGDALADGGRIRWGHLPERLAREVRRPLRDLLVSFVSSCEECRGFQMWAARCAAMVDPTALPKAKQEDIGWGRLLGAAQEALRLAGGIHDR